MSNVVFDISVSLDGYVTAAGQTPDAPLGTGGERLHAWVDSPEGRRQLAKSADLGAVICGRRTYDDAVPWWKSDGPTGELQIPVVVVTHRPADSHGVYHFAPDIPAALAQARKLAGAKTVTVMGGASVGRQFLAAGLVDELSLHIVPIVLAGGSRLFETEIPLTPVEAITTPEAIHTRFKVGT